MFVPCDEDGNVLEEPKGTNLESSFFEMQVDFNLNKKYQKAKEKVLFEGFELKKHEGEIEFTIKYKNCYAFHYKKEWKLGIGIKLIEDLIPDNLILTEKAIKTLNL